MITLNMIFTLITLTTYIFFYKCVHNIVGECVIIKNKHYRAGSTALFVSRVFRGFTLLNKALAVSFTLLITYSPLRIIMFFKQTFRFALYKLALDLEACL